MGQVFGDSSDLSTIAYVIAIEGGRTRARRDDPSTRERSQPRISFPREAIGHFKPRGEEHRAGLMVYWCGDMLEVPTGPISDEGNKISHGSMKCRKGRQGTWKIADAVPSPKPDG